MKKKIIDYNGKFLFPFVEGLVHCKSSLEPQYQKLKQYGKTDQLFVEE